MPPIYDYHQVIQADDIEAAEDLLDASGKPVTQVDCAICMNPVDIVTSGGRTVYPSSLLARRAYMVSGGGFIYSLFALF